MKNANECMRCHNHRPETMRGSRGDRGSGPPTVTNAKNIEFSSNTGPDPPKIAKLQSQHSMLGHHRHASETPFDGVSLVG